MPTRLSLEGPDLEAVLAQVRAEYGEDARIVAADRVRSGGVGGFFAKERYEVSVELPDPLLELTDQADEEESSMTAAGAGSFAEVLAQLSPPAPAVEEPRPFRPAPVFTASLPRIEGEPVARSPRTSEVGAAVDAAVAALSALPAPPSPPSAPGDVLLVVGDGLLAYSCAAALAKRMRLDARQVRLASAGRCPGVPGSRQLIGADVAQEHVAGIRSGDAPGVVAVDAAFGPAGAALARSVISTCAPAAVWVLVDATRKTDDLADQLARLGRVDALVVHGAALTRDPGSVLELGVPVALLDGAPATRAAWLSVLGG